MSPTELARTELASFNPQIATSKTHSIALNRLQEKGKAAGGRFPMDSRNTAPCWLRRSSTQAAPSP